MQIKVIHVSDLHAGHFFDGAISAEGGTVRRRELIAALQNICVTAQKEKADFLLISGDLAESALPEEDWKKIDNCFEQCPETQILWIRGASDWDAPERQWPEHVHAIPAGFHKLEFPEKHTVIWGESWGSEKWSDGFAEFIPRAESRTIQILMTYGEAGENVSQRHPLDMEALKAMDVDYCALGGRHRMTLWGREGQIWAAYPGSPEPLNFTEEGDHGYLAVTLEKGDGYRIRSVTRNITAKRRVIKEIINIEAQKDNRGITDQIRKAYLKENRESDLCLAVLRGYRKGFAGLDTDGMRQQLAADFQFLKIADETQPELDLNALRDANENNLLGRYIATMQEKIRHASGEKERKTLEDALAAGAEALMDSSSRGR